MFSSIMLIFIYYGLCIGVMHQRTKTSSNKALLDTMTRKHIATVVIFIIVMTMFVWYLINLNQYIYYWDYSGYWTISIERMKYMFSHTFLENTSSLYYSINNDDYNIFLPTILAFPLKVFGYTFSNYVLLCFAMFAVPTFLVQGCIAVRIVKRPRTSSATLYVIAVILAGCFAQSYYALLRGYIDIAYLLPMSVAIYILLDYDFETVSFWKNCGVVSVLILIWICRRYTIFFLIGYAVAMLLKGAEVVRRDRGAIKRVVINFCELGTLGLAMLLLFFRKFFLHALLTNYGEMYSAYDAPIQHKIQTLIENFGLNTIIMVGLVGILCVVAKRKSGYIPLLSILVVETVLFWQTQDMGVQHYMILNVPAFTVCMMVFDADTDTVIQEKQTLFARVNYVLVILCIATVGTNFVKAFANDISNKGCGTIYAQRYYPLQRNDIDVIGSMVNRLNELTSETDDYIYVAASGSILNCDILRKANMPDTDNAVPHMYATCDVDLRDGFPTDFLNAKYVVATDPVQTHLATGQEVVSYLAEGVQDETSYIGCHFRFMEQYELDDGIIAKIYEKISGFSEDDLQNLRDYYDALYPGYSSIFAERIY